MIASVLPNIRSVDKSFSYNVPTEFIGDDRLRVGTKVRVEFKNRKVDGWIVNLDQSINLADGLKPLLKLLSYGPSPEVVELARLAATKWVGSESYFLSIATPKTQIRELNPALRKTRKASVEIDLGSTQGDILNHIEKGLQAGLFSFLFRLPPAMNHLWLVVAFWKLVNKNSVTNKKVIVIVPTQNSLDLVDGYLKKYPLKVARFPHDFKELLAQNSDINIILGNRSASFVPVPEDEIGGFVVFDCEDDALIEESSPSWNACEVVNMRSQSLHVPSVLVSSCPTLRQQSLFKQFKVGRHIEVSGWPKTVVLDIKDEDPHEAPFPKTLINSINSSSGLSYVVWNKLGGKKLLSCTKCSSLILDTACDGPMEKVSVDGQDLLRCRLCNSERLPFCQNCGGAKLKVLQKGSKALAYDLQTLLGSKKRVDDMSLVCESTDVIVGTLHIANLNRKASLISWLDFDQSLFAPDWKSSEIVLSYLAKLARLVGPRSNPDSGILFIRTAYCDHPLVEALVKGDPDVFFDQELRRRKVFGLPPFREIATIKGQSGTAISDYIKELESSDKNIEIAGPSDDGMFQLKADSMHDLSELFKKYPKPKFVKVAIGGRW